MTDRRSRRPATPSKDASGDSATKVHVVVSEDDFLVSETVASLLGEPGSAEVVHLTADSGGVPGLEDALFAQSLFASSRHVVIGGTERLASQSTERLIGALSRPLAADLVVVTVTGERPPAALMKGLEGVGRVQRLATPRRGEVIAWVRSRLKDAGLAADRETPGQLVEALGTDLRGLAQAVEQLGVRVGDSRSVGKGDVLALFPKLAEQPVWALYDALFARDGRKAYAVLHNLFDSGNDAIGILFAVASQNRLVMRAKSAVERSPSLSESQLAQAIGASVGRAAVVRRQAGQLSWEWLVRLHGLCAQADFDLKGGDEVRIVGLLPSEMILERLVDAALPAIEPIRG